jgi:eukaryotic-like serine/threonine-protein kinase
VALTVSDGPEIVKVPDVRDTALDKAQEQLKKDGLEPGLVTEEFSDDVTRGSVISTDPEAGARRRAGTAIALVVSKGKPIDVPDVTGDDPDDARAELEKAGLTVKTATEQVNSEVDKGKVAEQTPKADSRLAEGDTVTLTLSKGPEMVEVPNVVGASVDDAKSLLEQSGFKVDEDRGLLGLFGDTVKKQSVKAGKSAPKGSTITITIR